VRSLSVSLEPIALNDTMDLLKNGWRRGLERAGGSLRYCSGGGSKAHPASKPAGIPFRLKVPEIRVKTSTGKPRATFAWKPGIRLSNWR
jgi:hypothetical protein